MKSTVNLSKESFNSFKGIESIEDFKDYNVKKGVVVLAYPQVSEKTNAGLVKSAEVIKQEEIEVFKKPLLVIGVGDNDEEIAIGKRVYIKNATKPIQAIPIKNALDEIFITFYVYMSDILSISK